MAAWEPPEYPLGRARGRQRRVHKSLSCSALHLRKAEGHRR
eukprot:CAMPEP_0206448662 /NCGR_PEP_ID=MMETSP0324_2-20121206/17608_1 /ASSEMBLY_ACC=CAM_ASM_000836 /TAXON_ID=2866 /ORGANISM="Crypthecodinium cohnii, Strain Seligo" /LENGTH=40 /DNA_ID= /DNA_START= /DNA_END= /DNA_ORIENTATION=